MDKKTGPDSNGWPKNEFNLTNQKYDVNHTVVESETNRPVLMSIGVLNTPIKFLNRTASTTSTCSRTTPVSAANVKTNGIPVIRYQNLQNFPYRLVSQSSNDPNPRFTISGQLVNIHPNPYVNSGAHQLQPANSNQKIRPATGSGGDDVPKGVLKRFYSVPRGYELSSSSSPNRPNMTKVENVPKSSSRSGKKSIKISKKKLTALKVVAEDNSSKEITPSSSVTDFLEQDILEKGTEIFDSLDDQSLTVLVRKVMDLTNKMYGEYLAEELEKHLGSEKYRRIVSEGVTPYSDFITKKYAECDKENVSPPAAGSCEERLISACIKHSLDDCSNARPVGTFEKLEKDKGTSGVRVDAKGNRGNKDFVSYQIDESTMPTGTMEFKPIFGGLKNTLPIQQEEIVTNGTSKINVCDLIINKSQEEQKAAADIIICEKIAEFKRTGHSPAGDDLEEIFTFDNVNKIDSLLPEKIFESPEEPAGHCKKQFRDLCQPRNLLQVDGVESNETREKGLGKELFYEKVLLKKGHQENVPQKLSREAVPDKMLQKTMPCDTVLLKKVPDDTILQEKVICEDMRQDKMLKKDNMLHAAVIQKTSPCKYRLQEKVPYEAVVPKTPPHDDVPKKKDPHDKPCEATRKVLDEKSLPKKVSPGIFKKIILAQKGVQEVPICPTEKARRDADSQKKLHQFSNLNATDVGRKKPNQSQPKLMEQTVKCYKQLHQKRKQNFKNVRQTENVEKERRDENGKRFNMDPLLSSPSEHLENRSILSTSSSSSGSGKIFDFINTLSPEVCVVAKKCKISEESPINSQSTFKKMPSEQGEENTGERQHGSKCHTSKTARINKNKKLNSGHFKISILKKSKSQTDSNTPKTSLIIREEGTTVISKPKNEDISKVEQTPKCCEKGSSSAEEPLKMLDLALNRYPRRRHQIPVSLILIPKAEIIQTSELTKKESSTLSTEENMEDIKIGQNTTKESTFVKKVSELPNNEPNQTHTINAKNLSSEMQHDGEEMNKTNTFVVKNPSFRSAQALRGKQLLQDAIILGALEKEKLRQTDPSSSDESLSSGRETSQEETQKAEDNSLVKQSSASTDDVISPKSDSRLKSDSESILEVFVERTDTSPHGHIKEESTNIDQPSQNNASTSDSLKNDSCILEKEHQKDIVEKLVQTPEIFPRENDSDESDIESSMNDLAQLLLSMQDFPSSQTPKETSDTSTISNESFELFAQTTVKSLIIEADDDILNENNKEEEEVSQSEVSKAITKSDTLKEPVLNGLEAIRSKSMEVLAQTAVESLVIEADNNILVENNKEEEVSQSEGSKAITKGDTLKEPVLNDLKSIEAICSKSMEVLAHNTVETLIIEADNDILVKNNKEEEVSQSEGSKAITKGDTLKEPVLNDLKSIEAICSKSMEVLAHNTVETLIIEADNDILVEHNKEEEEVSQSDGSKAITKGDTLKEPVLNGFKSMEVLAQTAVKSLVIEADNDILVENHKGDIVSQSKVGKVVTKGDTIKEPVPISSKFNKNPDIDGVRDIAQLKDFRHSSSNIMSDVHEESSESVASDDCIVVEDETPVHHKIKIDLTSDKPTLVDDTDDCLLITDAECLYRSSSFSERTKAKPSSYTVEKAVLPKMNNLKRENSQKNVDCKQKVVTRHPMGISCEYPKIPKSLSVINITKTPLIGENPNFKQIKPGTSLTIECTSLPSNMNILTNNPIFDIKDNSISKAATNTISLPEISIELARKASSISEEPVWLQKRNSLEILQNFSAVSFLPVSVEPEKAKCQTPEDLSIISCNKIEPIIEITKSAESIDDTSLASGIIDTPLSRGSGSDVTQRQRRIKEFKKRRRHQMEKIKKLSTSIKSYIKNIRRDCDLLRILVQYECHDPTPFASAALQGKINRLLTMDKSLNRSDRALKSKKMSALKRHLKSMLMIQGKTFAHPKIGKGRRNVERRDGRSACQCIASISVKNEKESAGEESHTLFESPHYEESVVIKPVKTYGKARKDILRSLLTPKKTINQEVVLNKSVGFIDEIRKSSLDRDVNIEKERLESPESIVRCIMKYKDTPVSSVKKTNIISENMELSTVKGEVSPTSDVIIVEQEQQETPEIGGRFDFRRRGQKRQATDNNIISTEEEPSTPKRAWTLRTRKEGSYAEYTPPSNKRARPSRSPDLQRSYSLRSHSIGNRL